MDIDRIHTHGLAARSESAWRRWLVVGAALIAAHGASAAYYAHRYAEGRVAVAAGPLTLDMPFDNWAAATMGADSSAYLRTAENVAAGNGVVIQVPDALPARIEPFFYWGPGAPLALGWWLKLSGGDTMFTFFLFAGLVQLFFGVVAVATVNLYSSNTWALVLTALATGFCPPLQEWFYGVNLTSSEIVALIPLSLMMFALAKGFIAFRSAPAGTWRAAISWRIWSWFGLVSLLIGVHSLVRDSASVFAAFLACVLVGRAILADRRRLLLALSTAAILLIGVVVVRQPVKMWNKQRIGISTVCTSSEGCIWRYGLWLPHDQLEWYQSSGIGFGQYLDADAAARVEEYFKSGRPNPEMYSLGQLAQAIANRPGDAIAFKVARLPVLWLGADRWPNVQWRLTHSWCLGFYLMLIALIVVRIRRRQYVPEPLYLYLLLIFCASPLIHYEFRYTFPIWNSLMLVPGLLVATIWGTPSRCTPASPLAPG
jgi:hypothetical protein